MPVTRSRKNAGQRRAPVEQDGAGFAASVQTSAALLRLTTEGGDTTSGETHAMSLRLTTTPTGVATEEERAPADVTFTCERDMPREDAGTKMAAATKDADIAVAAVTVAAATTVTTTAMAANTGGDKTTRSIRSSTKSKRRRQAELAVREEIARLAAEEAKLAIEGARRKKELALVRLARLQEDSSSEEDEDDASSMNGCVASWLETQQDYRREQRDNMPLVTYATPEASSVQPHSAGVHDARGVPPPTHSVLDAPPPPALTRPIPELQSVHVHSSPARPPAHTRSVYVHDTYVTMSGHVGAPLTALTTSAYASQPAHPSSTVTTVAPPQPFEQRGSAVTTSMARTNTYISAPQLQVSEQVRSAAAIQTSGALNYEQTAQTFQTTNYAAESAWSHQHDAHTYHVEMRPNYTTAALTNDACGFLAVTSHAGAPLRPSVPCGPATPAGQGLISVDVLAEALARNESRRPREAPRYMQELPAFDGTSTEWLAFKAALRDTASYFSSIENVARIRRSLRGAARETVRNLLFAETTPEELVAALERRHGRPEILATAELQKLKNLPKQGDSARDIVELASTVANIVAAVAALKRDYLLHNPEPLQAVLNKLTSTVRFRWYDYHRKHEADATPVLQTFARFLTEEAAQCGAFAVPSGPSEIPSSSRQSPRVNNSARREKVYAVGEQSKIIIECQVCQADHGLFDCAKFREMDYEEKWEVAKKNKMCFRCLRSTHRRANCRSERCGVDGCTQPHHALLHRPTPATNMHVTETVASANDDRAYIQIVPVVLRGPKGTIEVHAFLDSGSTATMLHASVAAALGAEQTPDPMEIYGSAGVQHEQNSTRLNIRIRGKHENEEHDLLNVRTFEHMKRPSQSIEAKAVRGCKHLADVAHLLTYERVTPQLIIGQNNWPLLLTKESRVGGRDQPMATRTDLGWSLHGGGHSISKPSCFYMATIDEDITKDESFDALARSHFELESMGVEPRRPRNDPEDRALRILEKTTRHLADGHFETGLLWRDDDVFMKPNKETAMKRLINLEKKLERNPQLKEDYHQQMAHVLESGYAEPAPSTAIPGKTWYLPHFAVVNPHKKKIRIVHDAAARTHGMSLNDLLLPGPDLLQSLPGVLMRFRQHSVAVTADIREMFLQIRVRSEDRDALRFLWRETADQPPREYRMTSVVFGAASSPCSAIFVKNKNASNFTETYPDAARAVIVNHYMDDYLQSFPTIHEATKIAGEVEKVHKNARFEMRGWASNCPEVIPTQETQHVDICSRAQPTKTLGMRWDTHSDRLMFALDLSRVPADIMNGQRIPTKREALSMVMSLFDPLGLVTPVTTPAKRLLQDTWRLGGGWDDELPASLRPAWQDWTVQIRELATLRIPRCYDVCRGVDYQLHTFVDASEAAYAAAVYWRVRRSDGSVKVALVCAKSRITPLKPTSVPRLELQAALLGSRLTKTVEEGHDWKATRRTFWSDSRTVLGWIRADPRTFKTFVAHRLAEIEDVTKTNEWRWVPTKENVADDATRCTPSSFGSQHRWFTGPPFLQLEETQWPTEDPKNKATDTEEERKICFAIQSKSARRGGPPDAVKFSSWLRLVRATGRVLQFIELCRTKTHNRRHKEKKGESQAHSSQRQYKRLKTRHLRAAETWLIKASQRDSFEEELKSIECKQQLNKASRLANLALQVDESGVLRLKGRVGAAENIAAEQAHPVILDGDHAYTRLFIAHTHKRLLHASTEFVVNELRQHCWVVRLRPSVREVIRRCLVCRIRKTPPTSPATGDLPEARLAHHQRPFTYVGLDYFGPIEITVGRHHEKRWVALFTCLTVRAIHLEVAASLNTDSAISALRRFIARRGYPRQIWSDNGTNFRGADTELRSALGAMAEDATNRFIEWRFIPPGAPFMGGVWERLVRSTKEALRVTLHERYPKEETLTTLLAEAESTINSRPLTHVAVTPDEPEALTPNHFLLGSGSTAPPPGNFNAHDADSRAQWRRAQQLADVFWRRWVKEYLPDLQWRQQPTSKGQAPQVGDIVLIVDTNLPRNTWPRGRIAVLHPGKDGVVRVVDVLTQGRLYRRPVKKIVVLPTEDESSGQSTGRASKKRSPSSSPVKDRRAVDGGRDVADGDNIE